MAALLSDGPDSCNLTPENYHDKFKQIAALFTTLSSIPPEATSLAAVATALSLHSKEPKTSVNIEAPIHGCAAGSSSVPPPQVTPAQSEK